MIINPPNSGKDLPELSNPASSSDLLSGKQMINESGEIVNGSMPTRSAQTITPGINNQTIAAGQYLSGAQTVLGDSDLQASNIRSGVSIFNVAGTFTGEGVKIIAQGETSSRGEDVTIGLISTPAIVFVAAWVFPPIDQIGTGMAMKGGFNTVIPLYPSSYSNDRLILSLSDNSFTVSDLPSDYTIIDYVVLG